MEHRSVAFRGRWAFSAHRLVPSHAESNTGEQRWAPACERTTLQVVLTVLRAEGGGKPEHLKPACHGLLFILCLSPFVGDQTLPSVLGKFSVYI